MTEGKKVGSCSLPSELDRSNCVKDGKNKMRSSYSDILELMKHVSIQNTLRICNSPEKDVHISFEYSVLSSNGEISIVSDDAGDVKNQQNKMIQ